MARAGSDEGATEGGRPGTEQPVRNFGAQTCGALDGIVAAASAADRTTASFQPRTFTGPAALRHPPSVEPQHQRQQQQAGRQAQLMPKVSRPDQNFEEQRQEIMSRAERTKAYGAYMRRQADLRQKGELLEKLTKSKYFATMPVSSTHEAFAAPFGAETAADAAATAAVSAAISSRKGAQIDAALYARGIPESPRYLIAPLDAGNGGELSKQQQVLVQQQLLYQQQQFLLQQQELLRQQQEQQTRLQQQQEQLLQRQQQLLELHQQQQLSRPVDTQRSAAFSADRNVAMSPVESATLQLGELSNSTSHTADVENVPSRALLSFRDPCSTAPACTSAGASSAIKPSLSISNVHAFPPIAAYSAAAPKYSATRINAIAFDADLSPPAHENTCSAGGAPASPLHPTLPPRLRRIQPSSCGRMATAAALETQQQQQKLRRLYEEERRAYGEFLKHQIEQRKAAQKAEKELERKLYGVGCAAAIPGTLLWESRAGGVARESSNSEKTYAGVGSHRRVSAVAASPRCATGKPGAESGTDKVELSAGPQVVEDAVEICAESRSNWLRSNVSPNAEKDSVSSNVVSSTSNAYEENTLDSMLARSRSHITRGLSPKRRSNDDGGAGFSLVAAAEATAAAAAVEKKKQQADYREYLLMQMERKRCDRKTAGRKGAKDQQFEAKQQGKPSVRKATEEEGFRDRSVSSKPSTSLDVFGESVSTRLLLSPSATAEGAAAGARAEDSTAASGAAQTGRDNVTHTVYSCSRREGRGKSFAMPSNAESFACTGERQQQQHPGEAPEEQQRLLQEHEKRKAYQTALLQQIREREEARERQKQEKLREHEKERQLLYELFEQQRRTMRTGRKAVNNVALTKNATSEEFTTAATTAGAEVDSTYEVAVTAPPEGHVEFEGRKVSAHTRRDVQFEGKEKSEASGAFRCAAAAKEKGLYNPPRSTPAAALSRSPSSAVLASSPDACKNHQHSQQREQCSEISCGSGDGKTGETFQAAMAPLQRERRQPETTENLTSCLQTVHSEIQRHHEELRSMKLQQQLSAQQQRAQQAELTRFLSALTHKNDCAAIPGGKTAATTAAASIRGGNNSCSLHNLHSLLQHRCRCLDVPPRSCEGQVYQNSGGILKIASPTFVHMDCYAEKRNPATGETAVAHTGESVLQEAAHSGAVGAEGSTLSLDLGSKVSRPIYACLRAPLSDVSLEHCHNGLLQCGNLPVQQLLQHGEHEQQEESEMGIEILHVEKLEARNAPQPERESGEHASGHENEEKSAAAEEMRSSAYAAAGGGGVTQTSAISPLTRLRSSKVNDIIDSFTRWLKPGAISKEDISLRRCNSFSSSSSSISQPSALQIPTGERADAATTSMTGSQMVLPQDHPELHAQQRCTGFSASKSSCGCASSSNPFLGPREELRSCCFAPTEFSGSDGTAPQLMASNLFLPLVKEKPLFIHRREGGFSGERTISQTEIPNSDHRSCSLPHRRLHLTHAAPITGASATAYHCGTRKCCIANCSASPTASCSATQCLSRWNCAAASSCAVFGSCTCLQRKNVVTPACCLQLSDFCCCMPAHQQLSLSASNHQSMSTNLCTEQEHARACCCCTLTGRAAVHSPHVHHQQKVLYTPCNGANLDMDMQLSPYLEWHHQPLEELGIDGMLEQAQRFVEIRDVEPLEAPSFACSVEEELSQQQVCKKQTAPDFIRFAVEDNRHTSFAGGTLKKSTSLAPPANRFLLHRWLGGILAPPPSRDFPEQQQAQQSQDNGQPQQQQEGDGKEQQHRKGKEERRSLWRGGKSKPQQEGSVARTRSATAAARAGKRDRHATTTAAGSSSSDRLGEREGHVRSSRRESIAAAMPQATQRDAGPERQHSSSSAKGMLGLLGHMWDRRQRVERGNLVDEEACEVQPLRMSERIKMRLSWDAEQPWGLLLRQGAKHGEHFLSAAAAELQHCLEEEEQERQHRLRQQQQRRPVQQQQQQVRGQVGVSFAPNSEENQDKEQQNKIAAACLQKKKEPLKEKGGGRRRSSRSNPERRRGSTPQQQRRVSSKQEEETGGGADAAGKKGAKEISQTTCSSLAENGKDRAFLQTRATPGSPLSSAPPTPAVPPEPHEIPGNSKR